MVYYILREQGLLILFQGLIQWWDSQEVNMQHEVLGSNHFRHIFLTTQEDRIYAL